MNYHIDLNTNKIKIIKKYKKSNSHNKVLKIIFDKNEEKIYQQILIN